MWGASSGFPQQSAVADRQHGIPFRSRIAHHNNILCAQQPGARVGQWVVPELQTRRQHVPQLFGLVLPHDFAGSTVQTGDVLSERGKEQSPAVDADLPGINIVGRFPV